MSTLVDRFPSETKEYLGELNILNEVAALQRLTIGQLRQRFTDRLRRGHRRQ